MIRPWLTRARWVWRALWRSEQLDASMHEEMRFHIDMEVERLMREDGLDAHEARRKAHVAFGGVEKYKEEGRDTFGRRWIDTISLDTRLGIRMLVKHRWLTTVGGFAMAVAIAVGATFFEVVSEVLNPALPLEDGERIVAVQYISSETGVPERRVLHDFIAWRDELVSVEQLGAFRTADHNLVSGTGRPEPIKVAEITASGFEVARTPPLFGRYLIPTDERQGASPALVIGHQAWQSRFGGDPQIVGKVLTLAGVQHTVVGVMPDRLQVSSGSSILDSPFHKPARPRATAGSRASYIRSAGTWCDVARSAGGDDPFRPARRVGTS